MLTARIMQGRVAEVMDVVRQGAANPGLPVWKPVFARMLLYVGEVDEASEVLGELLAVDDPVPYDGMWLLAHMFVGEVVSRIGTPEQAAKQYRRLAPFAGRLGCIGTATRHSVTLGLATLAARAGQRDLAAEHFAAAHDQHIRTNSPFGSPRQSLRGAGSSSTPGTRCGSTTGLAEDNGFAGIVGEAAALLPD